MIAIDTNILVYAHRKDSEWHRESLQALTGLAESQQTWAIPWPCLHEFIAITTHPGIYLPPTPPMTAFASLSVWLDAPSCRLIGEGPGYFDILKSLAFTAKVKGPSIHDARVAAICLHHGVSVLWTADRDFSRYRKLKTHNPLLVSP